MVLVIFYYFFACSFSFLLGLWVCHNIRVKLSFIVTLTKTKKKKNFILRLVEIPVGCQRLLDEVVKCCLRCFEDLNPLWDLQISNFVRNKNKMKGREMESKRKCFYLNFLLSSKRTEADDECKYIGNEHGYNYGVLRKKHQL